MFSVIDDYGEYYSTCGYCKNDQETSIAHGMHAHRLRVSDYQELCDRGWRRSGAWVYKPNLKKTCCPSYTIRLDVSKFHPTKAQRKVLRQVHNFLAKHQESAAPKPEDAAESAEAGASSSVAALPDAAAASSAPHLARTKNLTAKTPPTHTPIDEVAAKIEVALASALRECVEEDRVPALPDAPQFVLKPPPKARKGKAPVVKDGLQYSCQAAIRYAALLKAAASKASAAASAAPSASEICSMLLAHPALLQCCGLLGVAATSLNGYMNFYGVGSAVEGGAGSMDRARPQGRAAQPPPPAAEGGSPMVVSESSDGPAGAGEVGAGGGQKEVRSASGDLRQAGQTEQGQQAGPSTSGSRAADAGRKGGRAAAGAGAAATETLLKFKMVMVPAAFEDASYRLYCKYQVAIHGDDPSQLNETSYSKFLVDTPLVHVAPSAEPGPEAEATPQCGYGSFHQKYFLGSQLVAVGVVDVLPKCISSKYFFWDPDLAHLSLGKYSVMEEIDWVLQTKKTCPNLKYYYLGYHIHTCPKMRYKTEYQPSDLLCPLTLRWAPYAEVEHLLDPYPLEGFFSIVGRPGETADSFQPKAVSQSTLDATVLLIPGFGVIPFNTVAEMDISSDQMLKLKRRIKRWQRRVGSKVAKNMVYLLDVASLISDDALSPVFRMQGDEGENEDDMHVSDDEEEDDEDVDEAIEDPEEDPIEEPAGETMEQTVEI